MSIAEYTLAHHGIKGQKWGVRRYQNSDGSLTAAGRKRYEKEETKRENKERKQALKTINRSYKQQKLKEKIIEDANISKLYKHRKMFTDEEISSVIRRASLYNQAKSMNKSALDKAVNFINKSTNVVDTGLRAFSTYNRLAGTVNKVSGEKIMKNFDPDIREAARNALKEKRLREVPYDEVLANLDKYSTKDLETISKRSTYVKVLERNK